jgi:hypothetical protein
LRIGTGCNRLAEALGTPVRWRFPVMMPAQRRTIDEGFLLFKRIEPELGNLNWDN